MNVFTGSSRTTCMILACSLLLASGACGQPAAQADTQVLEAAQKLVVSSAAQLERTLRTAPPGSIILLSSGRYPELKITNIEVQKNITVTSENATQPAVISGISLKAVSGLTFRNISIVPGGDGGSTLKYGVLVLDCADLAFVDMTFRGAGDRVDPSIVSAVMLRNSNKILVERSHFTFFHHGLAMLDSTNVHLRLNEFENMQTDSIRGGGISDAVIEYNVMTGYHPVQTDHPDGIQLWSTNQKEPGRNIAIRDNLVVRGDGEPTQGVFVRDTKNTTPFENLTITGNLVIGSLYNGIAVNGVIGGLIVNNEVISDPNRRSWIRVENGKNVQLTNNRAERFVIRNNSGPIVQKSNHLTNPTSKNIDLRIGEWVMSKPGFAQYRGPVLRRLLAPK